MATSVEQFASTGGYEVSGLVPITDNEGGVL